MNDPISRGQGEEIIRLLTAMNKEFGEFRQEVNERLNNIEADVQEVKGVSECFPEFSDIVRQSLSGIRRDLDALVKNP